MNKILIVEDDFYIREIYLKSFQKAGFFVDEASDGALAMEKGALNTYDVILLDIMLPKVTGIDVLKNFRSPSSKAKDTPIFLISNLGQENIVKEAFHIGADGFFLKSQFTPEDLVNEVKLYLEKGISLLNQTPQNNPPPT